MNKTNESAVSFLLFPLPDFALLPFSGFIDKLRFTADEEDFSRQRYCMWQILGLETGKIQSSSHVEVNIQLTAREVSFKNIDYLVLFGCRTARDSIQYAPSLKPLLRQALASGTKLVAIDNASFVLASCGFLDSKSASIHWRHQPEFRAMYPKVKILENDLYCIDNHLITCAGGTAAIDLAVELLSQKVGREQALKGLADMIVDEPRSHFHKLKSISENVHASRLVQRAISLMRTYLSSSKTVDQIADHIGISRRQLDRQFLDTFSVTAHNYWTEMRLQHVHWRLVNSSHHLDILAEEVGIKDSHYLRKLLTKRFGKTAIEIRQTSMAE